MTTQDDARRRKTTQDDARRRKTTQDDARRRKTTQDDARRRKTTQDDARRRKIEAISELLYKKYQPIKAVGVFLKHFSQEKTQARKQAILNRLKDYLKIRKQLPFHYEVAKILENQAECYNSYDYGEGYFYQGCQSLHITGFRNTEARISGMHLKDYIQDKTVLDIGTNAGFLAIEIAPFCKSILGFDINPYLIEVAQCGAKFLNLTNTEFFAGVFEDFDRKETYDVVLSFANHSTYDHNTSQSIENYFKKCYRYIKEDGLLLFESHLPSYEKPEQLEQVLKVLQQHFNIKMMYKLTHGTSGDKGRTFAVCTKK